MCEQAILFLAVLATALPQLSGRSVAEHRLGDREAAEFTHDLTSGLVRRAYRI